MRPHTKLSLRTDKCSAWELDNAMNLRAFMRRMAGGVAGITALGMAPFLKLESKAF